MRVTLQDFLPHIKNYSESMSMDYVLKNPVTSGHAVVVSSCSKILLATPGICLYDMGNQFGEVKVSLKLSWSVHANQNQTKDPMK